MSTLKTILKQILEQLKDKELDENEKDIIETGITNSYFKEDYEGKASVIDEFFDKNIIILKDVDFARDENFKNKILDKIVKIKFSNCIFNKFNFFENNQYLFNNCIFKNDLDLKNCKTFFNETLFSNCTLKKVVLNNQNIDSILFDNCIIEDLKANEVLFSKTVFYDTFDSYYKYKKLANYKQLTFNNCKFLTEFTIGIKIKLDSLNFNSCKFDNSVNMHIEHPIQYIGFKFCTFSQKVDLNSIIIKDSFEINNSTFKSNLILDDSIIENIDLIKNNFETILSISTKEIKYSTFIDNSFEILNFRKAVVDTLDLSKSTYIGKSDFWGIESKIKNRETARIIKDSFEQQNNIIEANKFYALEMEKREEELKDDVNKGKNFFEYLVFLFHSLSSNHSQNWVLALFWIISSTFGYTILNCYEFKNNIFFGMWIVVSIIVALGIGLFLKEYIKDKIIHTIFMGVFLFIYYLVYGLTLEDFSLYKFSNNLNPFSIMTEFSDLNFLTLIFKITIAYLIYQLIVSIRQNTRRK